MVYPNICHYPAFIRQCKDSGLDTTITLSNSHILKMASSDFKGNFIETAINTGVLLFGEFTLKSGRLVCPPAHPYSVS